MPRHKTFNSSGVPPDGVLFAGDENAMQDRAAELANFSQTVDVGTLRIAESALQLLRFASSPLEARITAALRVDGILRGLGGLYAGTFTTTQRDAIPAGSRPFGLVILNTTTVRFEWNAGTDAVPRWQAVGQAEFGYVENTAGTIVVSNNQGTLTNPVLTLTNFQCDGQAALIELYLPWVKAGAGGTVGFDIAQTDAGGIVLGTFGITADPNGGPMMMTRRAAISGVGLRTFDVYAWKTVSNGEIKTGVGGNTGGGGNIGVLNPGFLRVSKAT